jgi:hypothetical protein
MCSFVIKIIDIDVNKRMYEYLIMDPNFFLKNRKYYTLDSNPVKFYFTKNNKMYFINLNGILEKHIYKKKLLSLDYHYSFCTSDYKFKISSEEQNLDANLAINEILFIRSNLVFDCCG